jgi:hypothetical protein
LLQNATTISIFLCFFWGGGLALQEKRGLLKQKKKIGPETKRRKPKEQHFKIL